MNVFHETADRLNAIENELGDNATPDQRIALAQAWATLSVSQELSQIWDDGLKVAKVEQAGSDNRFS
jgi:hypothetical protein